MAFAASRVWPNRAPAISLPFDGTPGPRNAITDAASGTISRVTLIQDLANGRKARTGASTVLPRGRHTAETRQALR